MKRTSLFLMAMLILSACGGEEKKLNQGPAPTSPGPTTPAPSTPGASGPWTPQQTSALLDYCYREVSHLLFCYCYTSRVTQMISFDEYNNNETKFNEVHTQLKTDGALATCLGQTPGGTQQQSSVDKL